MMATIRALLAQVPKAGEDVAVAIVEKLLDVALVIVEKLLQDILPYILEEMRKFLFFLLVDLPNAVIEGELRRNESHGDTSNDGFLNSQGNKS